jgi:NAD(P) transhydrogenase subunit beta
VTALETVVRLTYLAAAVAFVAGLHLMNTPRTARLGNRVSAVGMAAALIATLVLLIDAGTATTAGLLALAAGTVVGAAAGVYGARTVRMTAMPQLVSVFNAVGGGAAALVALHAFVSAPGVGLSARVAVPTALDVLVGAVTFTGSLVASGKLQGVVTGRPVVFPGARATNAALALAAVGAAVLLAAGVGGNAAMTVLVLAALGFGVTMVLPIGGADMPVVISLLNAFTGTAVAMAGLVIGSSVLVVAGAIVGAAGGILTKLMADAMNRSLASIVLGGFGTGDGDGAAAPAGTATAVRRIGADDAAIQLAYAAKVVIVPGYGLAAAQAQHAVHALAKLLEERGVEVTYAVHPIAGRMPGHMNVLLAEADVPYPQLVDMDEANRDFPRTDVVLVVGANDVVNPAARRTGTPVSGMPILDVDRARNVIVIKRSMGHGYAGIDNELYTDPRTGMYFADAKAGLTEIAAAVTTLVG